MYQVRLSTFDFQDLKFLYTLRCNYVTISRIPRCKRNSSGSNGIKIYRRRLSRLSIERPYDQREISLIMYRLFINRGSVSWRYFHQTSTKRL